jgi:hypothetical protein
VHIIITVSVRKTGRRAVTAPRPIKAEHADEIICGLPRACSCFFLCLLDHSARHSAPHCRIESRNGHLRWHSVHCGAVRCVLWPGKTERRKVLLDLARSCGRVCLCSPVPTCSNAKAPASLLRSFRQPLHHQLSQRAALQASCLALLSRPPYLPYNSKGPPTLSLSQLLFHLQSQRENPPILVAHTGSRCPATPAGAVTVQGFLALLSLLLLFPLASQASQALESRFGVIGIYHGCSVYILDSIFFFCSDLLRLDFSTLQSSWLLTILKALHLEGALFLLVDRVGRLRSSGASPPILHPHQHQTQVKSRC